MENAPISSALFRPSCQVIEPPCTVFNEAPVRLATAPPTSPPLEEGAWTHRGRDWAVALGGKTHEIQLRMGGKHHETHPLLQYCVCALNVVSFFPPSSLGQTQSGHVQPCEVYLVTELCDADLHTVINSETPLSEDHVARNRNERTPRCSVEGWRDGGVVDHLGQVDGEKRLILLEKNICLSYNSDMFHILRYCIHRNLLWDVPYKPSLLAGFVPQWLGVGWTHADRKTLLATQRCPLLPVVGPGASSSGSVGNVVCDIPTVPS